MIEKNIVIRDLGIQDYLTCWQAMQSFTDQRDEHTSDEIWCLQHSPVFTQGQNGKPEHILNTSHIPVLQVDRGGQVTYHGPGQLVIYPLVNLKRKKLNIREFVTLLENTMIQVLSDYHISAHARRDAPGVYINDTQKIGSIGLRVRRGCSYHGLALNIDMDLQPFSQINPCGLSQITMTQLSQWIVKPDINVIAQQLISYLVKHLGYTTLTYQQDTYHGIKSETAC